MSWVSFITGGMTVIFGIVLFTSGPEEEMEEEIIEPTSESDFEEDGPSGRHVTLSCQTCRKLKRHKEIQNNLFQCIKCKRHVDIR
jgi:acetyl-CoA carboxylase beta subunit